MANPRKRKAIKDGRMEQMIKDQNEQSDRETTTDVAVGDVKIFSTTTTKIEEANPPMDPFIAKEIKEIDRISSNENKPTTKKKTTTKKKITSKKKIGGK